MPEAAPDSLPPSLRAALDAPPVPAKPWQDGIAPAYITLFLSVVFLDRLAPGTLLVGGLAPSCFGAILAALLGYWCLYYAPTMWGAATKRPLAVVATSTFGARGAAWVPGVLLGVVYVLWFAITIDFAVQYTLSALTACGLLDAKYLAMTTRGPFPMPSPLFLFVAASWTIASALIGTLAIRLVMAIMTVYPIFPAIALGLALVWALPTVGAGPVAARPAGSGGGFALATMAQLVFGFLACHGLTGADWGAASPSTRDVRLGGMVGVMLAAPILVAISLLIVAGSLGRNPSPAPAVASADLNRPKTPPMLARPSPTTLPEPARSPTTVQGGATLREVFFHRIGGRLGGLGLFTLALALLGPACSSPFVIARQFSSVWPRVPRWVWSMLGALATWPLIVVGISRDVPLVFGLIGGLTAPAVGAIAADYSRTRGCWPGPRRGVNPAGVIAWALGVASVPLLAATIRVVPEAKVVPSSIVAFATAFVAYRVLAALRLETASIAIPPVDEVSSP